MVVFIDRDLFFFSRYIFNIWGTFCGIANLYVVMCAIDESEWRVGLDDI